MNHKHPCNVNLKRIGLCRVILVTGMMVFTGTVTAKERSDCSPPLGCSVLTVDVRSVMERYQMQCAALSGKAGGDAIAVEEFYAWARPLLSTISKQLHAPIVDKSMVIAGGCDVTNSIARGLAVHCPPSAGTHP